MTMNDLPHLMRWGSDPYFRWYQWGMKPGRFEENMARRWIEHMSTPGEAGCWVIEHDARAIGFVNFRDYKPKAKSAEIVIGIGEPGLLGMRLGREALDLELCYLREMSRIHLIGVRYVRHN